MTTDNSSSRFNFYNENYTGSDINKWSKTELEVFFWLQPAYTIFRQPPLKKELSYFTMFSARGKVSPLFLLLLGERPIPAITPLFQCTANIPSAAFYYCPSNAAIWVLPQPLGKNCINSYLTL